MSDSFKHYKSKLLHKYFDWDVKDALKIKPLDRQSNIKSGLCVLSMLCKRDFYQYIVSIYSFTQLLNPEKIVVVNDGSLTQEHLDILLTMIPDLTVLNGTDYIDERVPTYTSWRRMLALESYIESYYVVQLDADLISRYDLSEIEQAYSENRSFILGTEIKERWTIEDAQERARARKNPNNKHVQQLAEENLESLKAINYKYYVRGCAGFAGYAKGSFSIDTLIDISNCMFGSIGDTWRNWGSEQTAANILIANQPSSIILPLELYGSVARYDEKLKLIHFLGTWRFDGFLYNKIAKEFIGKQLTIT
ncbi:hypothetical protein [Colwellia hornerae]|uniref:Uncharacterized protein n=1 Tax=Colwellia hornerae TaxID=89402 RepID=A0A5C6Q9K5_9GAMM|nr:hypothetical protein [Colwellia hornerae]TWX51086.1 hypothetical protein ESZ28_14945 [Colwellia hornerae]TWX56764.1 hypothetical protein ESZ26_14910 [Colwellia hornerae]TWX65734.1 hypothetical protein ESZ27_12175 [Colwellia hornerae]